VRTTTAASGAPCTRPRALLAPRIDHARSTSLPRARRRLKAAHLKKRADAALAAGDLRAAAARYAEALAAAPDRAGAHFLHGNLSIALARAGRHAEALAAADAAAAAAPSWPKAHWRRAAALLALGDAPGAVAAYAEARRLAARGDAPLAAECGAALRRAASRLTRAQLGAGLATLVAAAVAAGALAAPQDEDAGEAALAEAWFALVRAAGRPGGAPPPGHASMLDAYLSFLENGLPPADGYALRAAAQARAKCFLQARRDAGAAAALLAAEVRAAAGGGAGGRDNGAAGSADNKAAAAAPALRARLAAAYAALGEAYMAEPGHLDRDAFCAYRAYAAARDAAPPGGAPPGLLEALAEAGEGLGAGALERAAAEARAGGAGGGPLDGSAALRPGAGMSAAAAAGRSFRLDVALAFPRARAADLGARPREVLRAALAAAAGVPPAAVALERALAPAPLARPHLRVELRVWLGDRPREGAALAAALRAAPAAALDAAGGGAELAAALGAPDAAAGAAELVDATPGRGAGPGAGRGPADTAAGPQTGDDSNGASCALAAPAPPKTALELPYRQYRLVTAEGRPLERADKHPFCMSRVYYARGETPAAEAAAWAELADGSCRWRQSAGEVKVIALKVPRDLPARELEVEIRPFSLRVARRGTCEVYLEGRLHRGVVPEDSLWTLGGGAGEDGCALSLAKMNLEVLARPWAHAESWWPRLLEGHGDIAWDDYEKVSEGGGAGLGGGWWVVVGGGWFGSAGPQLGGGGGVGFIMDEA
jgi:hypothetical protein